MMDNEQAKDTAKHTYTMCVLFGLWLQQKEQRKRLAKTEMSNLFDEWINKVLQEVQNAKD
jgi:hypothetical protein